MTNTQIVDQIHFCQNNRTKPLVRYYPMTGEVTHVSCVPLDYEPPQPRTLR